MCVGSDRALGAEDMNGRMFAALTTVSNETFRTNISRTPGEGGRARRRMSAEYYYVHAPAVGTCAGALIRARNIKTGPFESNEGKRELGKIRTNNVTRSRTGVGSTIIIRILARI